MSETEVTAYLPKGSLKTVEVSVGGHVVKVKTDATPSSLKQVQELVESKFEQISSRGPKKDTAQSALLVALNLAEELLHERERIRFLKRQVLDRSERLLERVESQLKRAGG